MRRQVLGTGKEVGSGGGAGFKEPMFCLESWVWTSEASGGAY